MYVNNFCYFVIRKKNVLLSLICDTLKNGRLKLCLLIKNVDMNIKISLLSVFMLTMTVCVSAQTARNPLNHEPARVKIQNGISSWKLSDETFYQTDGMKFNKSSYVYDETGRSISDITQSWSKSDEEWQNTSKSDYIYRENKRIVLSSVMNVTGWQNTSKVEIMLDSECRQLYSLSYSWNSSIDDWSIDPILKCEWVYDENGLVTEYLKRYMNKETNEWNDYYARIIYSYDEEGIVNEELYQLWNKDSNSWINKGRYTYSKEGDNKKVAISYFYASDKWLFDCKTIYIYDNDGKIARSEFYRNKADAPLGAYSLFNYSEGEVLHKLSEVGDISVYPNPVISSFDLTVPESLVGKTASVFDVYGNFIKSVVVNNEKIQVDVSGISGGIYVLQIGDKTKKFIVK